MSKVDNVALLIYSQWRELRNKMGNHKLSCDCNQCSKRRKLGAMLILPYAGAPEFIRLREQEP